MTTILKIETNYDTVLIRFQLLPRKRKAGASMISKIAEGIICDYLSIEASIPPDWISKSSIALEKEGETMNEAVAYFQIHYIAGKVSMGAFTSGRINRFKKEKLNTMARIGRIANKTQQLIDNEEAHPNR